MLTLHDAAARKLLRDGYATNNLVRPAMPRQTRLLQLDGLRGLAALSVVLFHYTFRYDEMIGQRDGLWYRFQFGEFGVALFFMLSGFVILTSLERAESLVDFARARAWRLVPTYWAAVALTFVVIHVSAASVPALGSLQVTPREAVLNMTMLPRLLGARYVDGVYWSLQAEIFFYAGVAAAWFALGRRWFLPTVSAWVMAGAAAHFLLPLATEPLGRASLLTKTSTILNLPYIHLFAIGIGLFEYHTRNNRWGLGLVALALAAHFAQRGAQEAAIVLGLALILALTIRERLPALAWRPWLVLGALSYPLYLIHQNLGYCELWWLTAHGVAPNLSVLLALLPALALAWILTHCVEQPAQRWYRARCQSRSQSAQVSRAAANLPLRPPEQREALLCLPQPN
jgi:peptidoglycan/LPS O-acetylase OafA/YrhL